MSVFRGTDNPLDLSGKQDAELTEMLEYHTNFCARVRAEQERRKPKRKSSGVTRWTYDKDDNPIQLK